MERENFGIAKQIHELSEKRRYLKYVHHEKKLWSLRSVPVIFIEQILKKLYFKPRLDNRILFKVSADIRKKIGKAVFSSHKTIKPK